MLDAVDFLIKSKIASRSGRLWLMSLMWSMTGNICGLKILNSELAEHFSSYGCSSNMFSFSKALLISLSTGSGIVKY